MSSSKQPKAAKATQQHPPTTPFPYGDYTAARDALLASLVTAHCYALLVGLSGMGKTWLLNELLGLLDRHRHQVIYLSSSHMSASGLVRFLAHAMHIQPRRAYLETVCAVTEAIRAQPAQVVIFVDEADLIHTDALQELRVLAECGTPADQLFSVVLSGLPALLTHLDAPALFPLKRRVTVRCSLTGLRREELDPFLEHRFAADAERVPAVARDDLFERTQATPGLIEQVVRQALSRTNGRLTSEQMHVALDVAGL